MAAIFTLFSRRNFLVHFRNMPPGEVRLAVKTTNIYGKRSTPGKLILNGAIAGRSRFRAKIEIM